MKSPFRSHIFITGWITIMVFGAIVVATSAYGLLKARDVVSKHITIVERSSFLMGDLGRQLARELALVLYAQTGRPDLAGVRARVEEIEDRVEGIVRELPAVLDGEELAQWNALAPVVENKRMVVLLALSLLEEGRIDESLGLIDNLISDAVLVQASLERLSEVSQRQTRKRLLSIQWWLTAILLIELLAALLLFLGIMLTMSIVYRKLKKQENKIDLYLSGLEQANRDLDAFAGRVAHDMRNTLAPLSFISKRLESSATTDTRGLSDLASKLNFVNTQATALIDGLLEFSRGLKKSGPEATTSVESAINKVVQELEEIISKAGVTLKVDVPEISVAMSSALLHSVLANTIGNATKFIGDGPQKLVSVTAQRVHEQCVITIRDTGPGIPKESLKKLFEPFYRVPGTSVPGFGLGLPTVRRIIEGHGGTIKIFSKAGGGTTVSISLPLPTVRNSA